MHFVRCNLSDPTKLNNQVVKSFFNVPTGYSINSVIKRNTWNIPLTAVQYNFSSTNLCEPCMRWIIKGIIFLF